MQYVVLLGSHVNSKLFYMEKDSAETALKRLLHDRAQWQDNVASANAHDTFEIRDDYDGWTVMQYADFRGFIVNSSEGNEASQIEIEVQNKTAQFKTQLRLQAIADDMGARKQS